MRIPCGGNLAPRAGGDKSEPFQGALEIGPAFPIYPVWRETRPPLLETEMANVNRYDPFVEIGEDFLKGFFVKPVAFESSETIHRMRIDVSEQNGEYKVLAELPG